MASVPTASLRLRTSNVAMIATPLRGQWSRATPPCSAGDDCAARRATVRFRAKRATAQGRSATQGRSGGSLPRPATKESPSKRTIGSAVDPQQAFRRRPFRGLSWEEGAWTDDRAGIS